MVLSEINFIGILIACVASYAFGSVYYMALAKPWAAALGKTEDEVKANMKPATFIIAFAAQVIMAFVLWGILVHVGELSIRSGVISALFVWFGFAMTTMAVNHGFQGARPSLTAIDGGHWLGVLVIQGAVLGWYGA